MTLKDLEIIPANIIAMKNKPVVYLPDIKADIIKTCRELDEESDKIVDSRRRHNIWEGKQALMKWAGVKEKDVM